MLATVNADGRVLPPLIIYAGKDLQSTWRGHKDLPGTVYSVPDSGWMTSEVFFSWFEQFCIVVKERPLLLIYDGHKTHLSIEAVKKAIKEKITLVKLPPHCTDLLQPLDKCCFGPLNRLWEGKLNAWVSFSGPRKPISKDIFANLLCEIWNEGISSKKVIAGFEVTGIYPIDKSKYPEKRLNPNLVKKYQTWIENGRKEEMVDILGNEISNASTTTQSSPSTPSKRPTSSINKTPSKSPKSPRKSPGNKCSCKVCQELGPKPIQAPEGKGYKPIWAIADVVETPKKHNKSFEEIILTKQNSSSKPTAKKPRRKVDLKARVFTSEQFLNTIEEKETKKKTKKIDFTADDDNDKDYDDDDDDDDENIFQYEREIPKRKVDVVAENNSELSEKEKLEKIVSEARRSLDDDKKGHYYAAFYDERYYKVLNVFSDDVDSDVHSVEFSFLTYKMNGIWDFPKKKDQSIVAVKYVFLGSVTPSAVVTGKGFRFDGDNDEEQKLFRLITKVHR